MKTSVERELGREVAVGAFAFAVLAGLFAFSIFVSGGLLWKRAERMEALFDDVMGLRKGDRVVLRGMSVGEVKSINLIKESGRIQVVCALTEPVRLRKDCWADVVATSVLGGRHLVLSEGSPYAEDLPEGAAVPGRRPSDLMADAGAIIRDLRETLEKGALDDLRSGVRHFREIAEKINKGGGTLSLLLNDPALYRDAAGVVADIKAVTGQVREGKGTLGKLLQDETLYADVRALAANARDVSQRLTDGKGFLGKLLSEDEKLYTDMKMLLKDARAAVDDYRESSPILTFTSVLFGAF